MVSLIILFFHLFVSPAEDFNIEEAYRQARFTHIAAHLQKQDYAKLTQHEKLLLIECLARSARGYTALERMETLLKEQPAHSQTLAAAGILYCSLGRLDKAGHYIDRALALDKDLAKALQARIMRLLYLQQYPQAEHWYERLLQKKADWADSNLFFFTGIEVYTGTRNAEKLDELYRRMAQKYKKSDKKYQRSLKANAGLYKKAARGQLFAVNTAAERVSVPFAGPTVLDGKKSIFIESGSQRFKVLLDTGSAVGWIIHSRDLSEMLKTSRGGRAFTRIGTETSRLYSFRMHTKKAAFPGFGMNHLVGQYVPKPRPEFYDANLNPIFIRTRVISLDFIGQQMILHTKESFDRELASWQGQEPIKLPWYGYEHALIPVTVSGQPGLAMIETGAQDIALKLDFARSLGLPLKQEKRYLANGQVFVFHKTAADIVVGNLRFRREAAEVWPLDRFHNPIIGLTPDVIIGPAAFDGRFIVSFDPFEKQVILRYKE